MSLNCKCVAEAAFHIHGMIDANAYHNSIATWPPPLKYVQINDADEVEFTDIKAAMNKLWAIDGEDIRHHSTVDIGGFLVKLNSCMYNTENPNYPAFMQDLEELCQTREEIKKLLNGRKRKDLKNNKELRQLDELEEREKNLLGVMTDVYRNDISSLIIVPTMDMEFAHIGGYDGVPISRSGYWNDDDNLTFQNWNRQISDIEHAAISNALRLFPLFSYDPRRYRLSDTDIYEREKYLGTWKEPFARIVGHDDFADNIKKIWLGFSMNPGLGFRPFDEFCEHLPRFYKECEKNNIPILAHCAPGGFTAHEAQYYPDQTDERIDRSHARHKMILKEGLSNCRDEALCSSMYYGKESVIVDNTYKGLDCFYRNYGHPRNWIPVLEYFPSLRLCLAGFGGNSEWQLADWSDCGAALPSRQWIRCIIQLTAKYENVYADVSGLNIYDKEIRSGLLKMLNFIQDNENDEFKHLKHKLIFGSGWYLTYLTDVSNSRNNVRHCYGNYCREFKNLFYAADKGRRGTLWEQVSLINPCHFYALSKDKMNKIQDELPNNANGGITV